MKLWICEKPAQGKLVAERIGVTGRGDGFIETKDGKVTWCIGHIVEMLAPGEYDEKWKSWSLDSLPVVPSKFDLKPSKGKEAQVKVIGKLLKESNHVIIATDGDREGELLGRELLDHFNWSGKIERMWNTNLDDESIDKALADIRPGANTETLYLAAQARSQGDYISGMTLTRAATKCFGNGDEVLSVGRVQTAVLGMIVRRDLEIENFTPKAFFDLKAELSKDGDSYSLTYAPKDEARIFDAEAARLLQEKIKGQTAPLSVERKRKRSAPPKLFSLSTLQQAANKAFGWSAADTKQIAQELYDAQLTSYPRTDCEFLPNEQEKDAPRILENLGKHDAYSGIVSGIGSELEFRKTVFNTSKTTAHHAIVPTVKAVDLSALSDKQQKLYDLVALRYLAAFMPDYEYDSTIVKLTVEDCEFKGSGSVPVAQGWKVLFSDADEDSKEDNQQFPALEDGEQATIDELNVLEKATKAPPRYTQASILVDMENISKFTEDPEIQAQIKARIKEDANPGIGTPATRDSFVEVLLKRSYIKVEKNKLISTDAGRKLVEALPDSLSDPIETTVMESQLDKIVDGELELKSFVDSIIGQVNSALNEIKGSASDFVKNDIEHPCSQCGKAMKKRKGQYGNFWSCSGYPECKHSMADKNGKPVEKQKAETSGECPKCSKPLALREGKSKATKKKYKFWGCTGYPDCKETYKDKNGKPVLDGA